MLAHREKRTRQLRDLFTSVLGAQTPFDLQSTLQALGPAFQSPPPDDPPLEAELLAVENGAEALLRDVQAAEFLEPAARTSASTLHPRSIVSRYQQWRERYSEDYNSAWGGLVLSGIWEFWARRELLQATIRGLSTLNLQELRWQADVHDYQSHQSQNGSMGGDDELMETLIDTSVIAPLTAMAESGAYDPWDSNSSAAAANLVHELNYVRDAGLPQLSVSGNALFFPRRLSTDARHSCSIL